MDISFNFQGNLGPNEMDNVVNFLFPFLFNFPQPDFLVSAQNEEQNMCIRCAINAFVSF